MECQDSSVVLIVKNVLLGELRALSRSLLRMYQAAYALAALPIGSVLSISPVFLKQQQNVPVAIIGYSMMVGEICGILCMKYAEMSSYGFFLRRPRDLYLILGMVAFGLFTFPLWPQHLWYLSVFSMVIVQSFNSASKPVVAEALHRMALLTDSEPSHSFAVANMWRRMGNATIGAMAPIMYAFHPMAMFFVPAPITAGYILICVTLEVITSSATSRTNEIVHALMFTDPTRQPRKGRDVSMVGALKGALATASAEGQQKRGSVFAIREGLEEESKLRSFVAFLVVHLFSFWDAAISRLPFAYMTFEILKDQDTIKTCLVLFGYQSCRAISQSIQARLTNHIVNVSLSLVAVGGYVILLAMIYFKGTTFWFIPVMLTGLSETLPVQQFYLNIMFNVAQNPSADAEVRELVRASHTGTGLGSAVAFGVGAAIYAKAGLGAVALIGLAIAISKLMTVGFIMVFLPYVVLTSAPNVAANDSGSMTFENIFDDEVKSRLSTRISLRSNESDEAVPTAPSTPSERAMLPNLLQHADAAESHKNFKLDPRQVSQPTEVGESAHEIIPEVASDEFNI